MEQVASAVDAWKKPATRCARTRSDSRRDRTRNRARKVVRSSFIRSPNIPEEMKRWKAKSGAVYVLRLRVNLSFLKTYMHMEAPVTATGNKAWLG